MDTEKDRQNTEDTILLAAEKEFLEKGFNLTKTTEIARLAGVNHAMLHYYFRTKENLFEKILKKKVKEVANSLLTIIEQDLPFTEKIKAGIEAHFDFISSNPKLPLFIINEFILNTNRINIYGPIILPTVIKVYRTIEKGIEEGVKTKTIRPIAPVQLIYDIVTLNIGAFIIQPVAQRLFPLTAEDYQNYLQVRKTENVETILSRLRV